MPRISSCRLYFLPGAEEPKGGWGLAGKVSSALPPSRTIHQPTAHL